jgi:hypothetical protein
VRRAPIPQPVVLDLRDLTSYNAEVAAIVLTSSAFLF